MIEFKKEQWYNCNHKGTNIFKFEAYKDEKDPTRGILYSKGYVDGDIKEDHITNISYLRSATECDPKLVKKYFPDETFEPQIIQQYSIF
jgi:hypothetical protein